MDGVTADEWATVVLVGACLFGLGFIAGFLGWPW